MSAVYRAVSRYLRTTTIAEWIVVVAILAVPIALIVPAPQWAGTGSIRFPVRVLVFDATHGIPIADAKVVIFLAPLLLDSNALEEYRDRYDPTRFDQISETPEGFRFRKGITEADGTVVIEFEFGTGSSHRQPKAHAHLGNAWVSVQADGYGGVVIPVRQDSQSTAAMREQKELLVPVGLVPLR